MTADKVRLFFARKGLEDRITVRSEVSDTAEHSAKAIGCEIGQIAKTLSFLQDGKVVIILMSGEAKVDNKKYRQQFGMKASMVPFDKVEAYQATHRAPYRRICWPKARKSISTSLCSATMYCIRQPAA